LKQFLRFLFIGLAALLVLVAMLAAYMYFSVDNRIKSVQSKEFSKSEFVTRLDSTRISSDSVTQFITQLTERAHVQGCAVSIINLDTIVYQNYFGKRNVRKNEAFEGGDIWYAASLSKTVFADVVLQLCEEKIIHLDTPLVHYLKYPLPEYSNTIVQQFFGATPVDYSDLKGDPRLPLITARMCLSHTSGLPNWRWLEPDGKLRIKFDPGSRYSYSGEGMFLLQVVIEELTGQTLESLAVEKVFKPLEMESTSFRWQRGYEGHYVVGHDRNDSDLRIPKSNSPNGAGSMSTTLEDYTMFFQRVLGQGNSRYRELITPQVRITSKQQFGPNALTDTSDNDDIELSYGLGFGVYQTPYGRVFFKEGHLEGWQHYAVGFPERGLGLIIMTNSDQGEGIFKELIEFTTGNTFTPWYWEGYIPYRP
jgi:serine-type D-Ala-D-Ala carboxypeptidase/endopeptidase